MLVLEKDLVRVTFVGAENELKALYDLHEVDLVA